MKRFGSRWRALTLGALVAGMVAMHPAAVRAATTEQLDGVNFTCDEVGLEKALVLVTLAGGGTVQFTVDCSITLTGPISLTGPVTIDGNGHAVTISGGSTSPSTGVQVFSVNSDANVTLQDLTIANGSAAIGGGILNGGTLSVTNSTISGNSATGLGGGGIFNAGTLIVTNSTFSGNSADAGGGIFNNHGTVSVTNSTFSGNSATGLGGGIFTYNTVSLANTILANSPAGGDCYFFQSTVTDNGGNLADDASCTGTATAGLGASLGPLANNGGPTDTIALGAGSSAIGYGLESVCAAAPVNSLDQRGDPRNTIACDSGAYDTGDPITQATVTLTIPTPYTYNGTAPSVSASVLPLSCGPVPLSYSGSNGTTYGSSTTAPTNVGSYAVTASLGNANCIVASGGTGTLTISPAAQTITFGPLPDHAAGDPPVTVSATGGASGNPVMFTIDSSTPATVCTASGTNGATITIVGPGTCTVDANQAGNGNYSAAPQVAQSFTIHDTDLGQPTVPGNITTPATSAAGAVVTWPQQTASDEGGETPTVTCQSGSLTSGSTFPVGTTTVTCIATDSDDTNTPLTNSFTVTVTDTDLALINMPGPITTVATSSAGAVVTYTLPTVVDEDNPLPTVRCDHASGTIFPIGTTTVTCTATDSDDSSGTVSKTFTVTVTARYGVKLLYKAPMTGKVGSAVPIKIELVNAAGQNLSSSSLGVTALCVVVQGASDCSHAVISYGTGSPCTFTASLATGGGYQFNVKTTGLTTVKTYQLLFRVAGEDSSSYHAEANATFTLTK